MARFLGLGSEIRIRDLGVEKSGFRTQDKYSGSATLLSRVVGLKSPASVQ